MDLVLSQLVIFGIILILVLVIIAYFRKAFKKIRVSHLLKKNQLMQSISVHNLQIQRRNMGLNHYDFLKYNLREALIIQPEIKIL